MQSIGILLAALVLASASPMNASSLVTPTQRDGHNDFNFLFGRWHTHYRILRHRLAHDTEWDECDGEASVVPFWESYGNLETGTLHCPPPRGYIESMTLRWYNGGTHQWSLWWGTKTIGVAEPPQVGHFNADGLGEFFADDTFNGKPIIVRYQWNMVNGLPHFEQAYSDDGGKAWETNWICEYTKQR